MYSYAECCIKNNNQKLDRHLILIGTAHAAEQDLAAMIPSVLVCPHYFPLYTSMTINNITYNRGYWKREQTFDAN